MLHLPALFIEIFRVMLGANPESNESKIILPVITLIGSQKQNYSANVQLFKAKLPQISKLNVTDHIIFT